MGERIDGAEREHARRTLRQLLDSAAGPRLKPCARPWSASGLARAAIGVGGVVVVLVVVAIFGFAYLVAGESIDLARFKPALVSALQQRLGAGYRVTLGSTTLTHSAEGFGLGLGFTEIRVADAQGRTLVAAPSGRIGLDLIALVGFNVSVRRLELDGLELNLRVARDGAVSIAAAGGGDSASLTFAPPANVGGAALANPGAIVLGLAEALAGASQPLDHIAIAHGDLRVENEALGRSLAYQDLSISYDRAGASAAVAVSARGAAGAWRIGARAALGSTRRLTLEARDLGLHDLLMVSAGRPPFETDMPLSMTLSAEVDGKGALQAAEAAFAFGAGHFKLDDPDHKAFLIDEASGKLAWNPAAGRFDARGLEMLAGPSHYHFDGALTPPVNGQGPWGLHFESHDSVYGPERSGQALVVIDKAVADARFFPDDGRLSVDRLTVHGPRVQGEMTMLVTPEGDSAALKMDLRANSTSLVDGFRLWPTHINPDVRNWCVEHVHAGEILSGELKIDFSAQNMRDALAKRPLPAEAIHAEFTARGGSVDLIAGVPPLSQMEGAGVLTGKTFELRAKSGQMDLSPGRRLSAAEIYFRVPNTDPAPVVAAEAGGRVTGGADSLAELLSREAMKPYAGLSVDPAKIKGQAQGQLTLALALGKTARPEDQKFRIEGGLSNLSVDGFIGSEKFEQGALDVFADGGAMKLTGQGLFNGLAAKVDIAKAPTEDGQMALTLTLDNAARAKLNLNPGVVLNGPITAKLKTQFNRQGADAEVDLTKADISGLDGTLLKAAGKPGKATFTVKTGADGLAMSALAVDAGSLFARGAGQFGPDNALQNLKLTQLRFAPNDDLKLEVQGGSPTKASIRGAMVDARGFVKSLLGHDPAPPSAKDLDLDIKVDAARGANDQTLSQLDAQIARRGGVMRSLKLRGRLGQGAFAASKEDNGPLDMTAQDAGAAARFFDLYTRIDGGALHLMLTDGPDGSQGVATIKNFKLRNETALRKMSSAAPQPVRSNLNDGDAVHFDRFNATFVRSGNGRTDIKDLLVYNNSQGISANGYIDFNRDKVELAGTFVPIYPVNSLITGIPVVGVLLGGGQHEGIFAVNFRVTGPASAPTLTINPLSGVTPGIFRKIFGVFDGTQLPTSPPEPDAVDK